METDKQVEDATFMGSACSFLFGVGRLASQKARIATIEALKKFFKQFHHSKKKQFRQVLKQLRNFECSWISKKELKKTIGEVVFLQPSQGVSNNTKWRPST